MPTLPFHEHEPRIAGSVFIAPDAWVTGKVVLEKDVSLFFGAVIRGDVQNVSVGEASNIQEHAVLHTSTGLQDCLVGKFVTIGHHAIVHGCSVGDNTIVGMGATLLDGAVVGKNCIIGANSLVTMNFNIPEGHLAFGNPAKVIRALSADEIRLNRESALHYVEVARFYRKYFESAR